MYQSIGINLSKRLDASTKRIKVPAITQRSYYKDLNNYDFVKFYDSSSSDAEMDYDENLNYLDDDYNDDECTCKCSCFKEKIKSLDSKMLVGASIGALIGCIGLYTLLKKK